MTSLSASTDFFAAIALPTLTDGAGVMHTATRHPRLKDGMAFMQAAERGASMVDQLGSARDLLIGMGFPEATVDDLDIRTVVESALRFFTAAFQIAPSPNGSG